MQDGLVAARRQAQAQQEEQLLELVRHQAFLDEQLHVLEQFPVDHIGSESCSAIRDSASTCP